MDCTDEPLRQTLVAMAEHDLSVREELAATGALASHGYHPRMEAVHQENTAALKVIIDQRGWPGEGLVGEQGAWAAWLIAQHAIGNPPFMRRCLSLVREAAGRGEIPRWQEAMLEDRIRMYEGRPQLYGTQFQPDEEGELVPYEIEAPAGVNERRRAVGLNTLEDRTAEMQAQSAREKIIPPPGWEEEYERWLRSVGWRE